LSLRNEEIKDPFEKVLRAAHALMRRKEGEEACQVLARAKEEALARKDLDEAALYSSVRGSYLVAMGRDEEASEAYSQAEAMSQGNPHYQLTTARHLVSAMSQPGIALQKVDSALDQLDQTAGNAALSQDARAVRGLALLALGEPEKATIELSTMHRLLAETDLPSLSCDLTLVEALCRQPSARRICSRYLKLVEARARNEGETRVLNKILELKHHF